MALVGLDSAVSFEYADIYVFLESKGQPIELSDLRIVAHARFLIVPRMTDNIHEFSHVPDLAIDT